MPLLREFYTRDGMVIAWYALIDFPMEGTGEFSCNTVHPEHQNRRLATAVLHPASRRARFHGLSQLFVPGSRMEGNPLEGPMTTSPLLRFSRRLENESEVLDRLRKKVPFQRFFTARPGLHALLQGRSLGHALHPVLVQVPLGTLTGALLSDALGEPDAADKLLVVSLLSFAPTAITGWAEWVDADERSQRVGLVHAGVTAAGIWLVALSALARHRNNRVPGVVFAGLAGAVWSLGAYLGGHLTLARKYASHADGDTSGAGYGSYPG